MTSDPFASRDRKLSGTSDAATSSHILSKTSLISVLSDTCCPPAAVSSLRSRGSTSDSRPAPTASRKWTSLSYHLSISTDEAPSWDWRIEEASSREHAHFPFCHMTATRAWMQCARIAVRGFGSDVIFAAASHVSTESVPHGSFVDWAHWPKIAWK